MSTFDFKSFLFSRRTYDYNEKLLIALGSTDFLHLSQ